MLTYEELKEKLLNTHYFIDNEFLDAYLKLVIENYTNTKYDEIHHIIPKTFFKHFKLPIDNSDENLVKLSFSNHCRAHYLMSKCSLDFLRRNNNYALRFMINTKKSKYNLLALTDKDFQDLQYYYEQSVIHIDEKEFIEFYTTHTVLETVEKFQINRKFVSDLADKLHCRKHPIEKINRNRIIPKEELEKFYIQEKHTLVETANYFSVNKSTIIRRLNKYHMNQHKNKYKHNKRKDYSHIVDFEEFIEYTNQHNRDETCQYFNISHSFYKQLAKKLHISKLILNKSEIYQFYLQNGAKKTLQTYKISKTSLYRIVNKFKKGN